MFEAGPAESSAHSVDRKQHEVKRQSESYGSVGIQFHPFRDCRAGDRVCPDEVRGIANRRGTSRFQNENVFAYTGLAAQPEKDGEILIALAAGGGSKEAAELSKGTRFQLYLAQRVAGYYEFVASRQPVPFIADDIMETFDDFRAEEAFRLFGEMAQVRQVIYLTHHPHLCEIARRVSPGARIHGLQVRG